MPRNGNQILLHTWHPSCCSCQHKPDYKFNSVCYIREKGTVLCLWHYEHICNHLWNGYSITVNQLVMASVKLTKGWFQLHHWNSSWNRFLMSNSLSGKSWYQIPSREFRINWEKYTSYAGAAGMLLHRNKKFTLGKLKASLLSKGFVFNRPTLSVL